MVDDLTSNDNFPLIEVEVVYALPDKQSLLTFDVEQKCTAIEAVQHSGILDLYPEIDLDNIDLGIFSDACNSDHILKAGDRVEIYRPLLADPREIRKRRAAEIAAKKRKKQTS